MLCGLAQLAVSLEDDLDGTLDDGRLIGLNRHLLGGGGWGGRGIGSVSHLGLGLGRNLWSGRGSLAGLRGRQVWDEEETDDEDETLDDGRILGLNRLGLATGGWTGRGIGSVVSQLGHGLGRNVWSGRGSLSGLRGRPVWDEEETDNEDETLDDGRILGLNRLGLGTRGWTGRGIGSVSHLGHGLGRNIWSGRGSLSGLRGRQVLDEEETDDEDETLDDGRILGLNRLGLGTGGWAGRGIGSVSHLGRGQGRNVLSGRGSLTGLRGRVWDEEDETSNDGLLRMRGNVALRLHRGSSLGARNVCPMCGKPMWRHSVCQMKSCINRRMCPKTC